MTRSLTISVIIPIKGRFPLVKEAINSIYSQDYDLNSIEIIVVEEKNYGEKVRFALKQIYPKIIILENKDKEGPGGSRNTGLRYASGKYIIFLDSDDQLRPNFLNKMVNILQNDNSSLGAICFSKSYFHSDFNFFERIKLYPLMLIRDISLMAAYLFNYRYLYPTSFYLCQISHMLFKADAVKKLRFRYDYRRGGEDWDFLIQVLIRGGIKILPERLLKFRYSLGSSTDTLLNRRLKWKSYAILANCLPANFKCGIFYKLFLQYINLFKVKNYSI